MSNPFKRTFQLVQHTPLIHFQYDQAGATLRATEVKPKLDRFIVDQFPKIDPTTAQKYQQEINIIERGLSEQQNSPYKLHIHANSTEVSYFYFDSFFSKTEDEATVFANKFERQLGHPVTCVAPSPYFADREIVKKSEDISGAKLGMLHKAPLCIQVFSLQPNFVELVGIALAPFFLVNNFGTRKSKGFGAFQIQSPIKDYPVTKVLLAVYAAAFKIAKPSSVEEIFKIIDDTYKNLKNKQVPAKDTRNKSEIRDYYENQDKDKLTWSKDIVTGRLANNNSNWKPKNNLEIKYIRVLLGLAGIHEYPQIKPHAVTVNIKDKQGEIERYSSPIRFLFHDNQMYLVAKDVPSILLDRVFNFYVGRDEVIAKRDNRLLPLSTPDTFSIADFLISANLKNWTNVK